MKCIIYWTFLVRQLMFNVHLRFWAMMQPSKQQDFTVSAMSHRVMGVGGTELFLKSTVVFTVITALSSTLLALHQVPQQSVSHQSVNAYQ